MREFGHVGRTERFKVNVFAGCRICQRQSAIGAGNQKKWRAAADVSGIALTRQSTQGATHKSLLASHRCQQGAGVSVNHGHHRWEAAEQPKIKIICTSLPPPKAIKSTNIFLWASSAARGGEVEQSFNFGRAAMQPQFGQKLQQRRRKNIEIATSLLFYSQRHKFLFLLCP